MGRFLFSAVLLATLLMSASPAMPQGPLPYDTVERATPRATRYRSAALQADSVLSDPDPHAARVEIDVPEELRNELFLVGPVLDRAAGSNLVVFGPQVGPGEDRLGEPGSFQPVLVHWLEESVDLVALAQACFVGSKRRESKALKGSPTVERRFTNGSGKVRVLVGR